MPGYITSSEASDRLALYGIDHTPPLGIVEAASDRLDAFRSFLGDKTAGDAQAREFPRDEAPDGETANLVPERVKRWVALEAYKMDVGESPGITSISTQIGSKSFETPKYERATMFQKGLLAPYLTRRAGAITSVPIERA